MINGGTDKGHDGKQGLVLRLVAQKNWEKHQGEVGGETQQRRKRVTNVRKPDLHVETEKRESDNKFWGRYFL